MAKLIGVFHLNSNLEGLINYVGENYPNIKSVMLELTPNWRNIKKARKLANGKTIDFLNLSQNILNKKMLK